MRALKYWVSVVSASLTLVCAAVAADSPALYQITRIIPLGAPEQWDYLSYDATSKRIYVAHGTSIDVLDAADGKLLGKIAVPGANGMAIVPALGKGYAGSRSLKAALVFDLHTFKILKSLPADEDTDAVVYDPASQRVFIMDGDPHNMTVIDTTSDTIVTKIALDGQPEFAAVDGRGKLFVNITDRKEIQRIDTKSAKVDATWPIAACEGPHGLAIDAAKNRLFSSCVNSKLLVVDSTNGAVIADLAIGKGSDATAYDPYRKRAFSSNREGTLSVIQEQAPDRYIPLAEVPTQLLARTMALNTETGRIYLVAADRIEIDPAAADPRKRYAVKAGSTRLLFADPAP
jgi:DNA-binding beta-propeller fold protein YncE